MHRLIQEIEKELHGLNPFYLQEVYDFVVFLREKQERQGDTEYLNSIPGMVDSIREEADKPLDDYSETLDR